MLPFLISFQIVWFWLEILWATSTYPHVCLCFCIIMKKEALAAAGTAVEGIYHLPISNLFQGKRSKCCTSTMTWPPSVSHCLHHLNLFKAFGSIETYVRICLFRLWCSVECRKGGRETFLKNDPQTVTGDFNISFSLQYKSPVSIA